MDELLQEFEKRKKILEWMAERKIRRYDEVANIVSEFYSSPEKILERTRVEKAVEPVKNDPPIDSNPSILKKYFSEEEINLIVSQILDVVENVLRRRNK